MLAPLILISSTLAAASPLHARLLREELRKPLVVSMTSDDPAVELIRLAGAPIGRGLLASFVTVDDQRICRAPCGETVDGHISNRYQLAGDGITPSEEFDLSTVQSNAVTIHVSSHRHARRVGGVLLTMFGGASVLGGTTLFSLGYPMVGSPYSRDTGATFEIVGEALMAAGVASALVGIYYWATSGTSFELEPRDVPVLPEPSGHPSETSI